MATRSPLGDRGLTLLSIVGFTSLTGALAIAYANPATGYELSIYAATPVGFWVGVGVAFLSALVVSIAGQHGWYTSLGVSLGGLASTAVITLPVVRGYYFRGGYDSVTHVGWVRELATGGMMPHELLYPAIHSIAAFLYSLTGFTVWRSTMLVPMIVAVAYFAFVPLLARALVGGDLATVAGAFSAFLLVPIHLIANTMNAHPSSQAILYAPVVLFLLVRFLRSTAPSGRSGLRSASSYALLVAVCAAILYHPQQALNLILLFVTISALQVVANSTQYLSWTGHRSLHSITALSVVAYLGWALHSPTVYSVALDTIASFRGYIVGSAPAAGSSVVSQTSALQAIGSSLTVIFLKLFSVSTVFVLLTVAVVLAAFGDRFNTMQVKPDTSALLRYLGIGLAVMFPVFLVYLLGNAAAHYFRQAGFMLGVGTVVGAVGITYEVRRLSRTRLSSVARMAMVGGFAVMLVLSTLAIYQSPYIHKSSKHVTEMRVSGYETTFEVMEESSAVASVRQDPERFHEALVDFGSTGLLDGHANSSSIRRLQTRRPGDYYFVTSTITYEREVKAYREYRYSAADLASVERQIGVARVHANGGLQLYYVS